MLFRERYRRYTCEQERLSVENDVAALANRLANCIIIQLIVTETLSVNEKPKMGLAGEGG